MQFPPGMPDPVEHELRLRATVRVARRRSFLVSAVVVGSLIVLNLFLYARTHNAVWLLLDAVFVCTLSFRAWVAFGTDRKEDEKIQREMARMRQMATPQNVGPFPPSGWSPPTPRPAPVPSPPPAQESKPTGSAIPAATNESPAPSDPWSGSWNF
jgi:hypothetical protein